jgi:hypothetical protein
MDSSKNSALWRPAVSANLAARTKRVPLTPNTLDVLVTLVAAQGNAVAKKVDLLCAMWPTTLVYQPKRMPKASGCGNAAVHFNIAIARHSPKFLAPNALCRESGVTWHHIHRRHRTTGH